MKVSDVIYRIEDMRTCIEYLEEWRDGEITEQTRKNALVRDIEQHLEAYVELLYNKEVK